MSKGIKTMPDTMKLNFTTSVLGRKAAKRLKDRQVTQTIRGDAASFIVEKPHPGQLVEITLDGVVLGQALLLSKERFILAELTVDDARRGGFDDRVELVASLQRAGFRYRSLNRYHAWRVRFEWRQPVPASEAGKLLLTYGMLGTIFKEGS